MSRAPLEYQWSQFGDAGKAYAEPLVKAVKIYIDGWFSQKDFGIQVCFDQNGRPHLGGRLSSKRDRC